MRVYVRLYGPLRVVTGSGEIALTLGGVSATVGQALDALMALYPQTRRYLLSASGAPAPGVRMLLADARLDDTTALATLLHDGDRLSLLMPVAGG